MANIPNCVSDPDAGRATSKRKGFATEGCAKPATAKGLCAAHYTAERRKDPEVMARAREASRRAHAKRQAAAKEN